MLAVSTCRARGGLAAGLLVALVVVPARAMVPIGTEVTSALDCAPVDRVLRLEAFPLDDGTTIALELERFEVWIPGAIVVERGDTGERLLPPPATRYFRGRVAGDPDSWAFLARDKTLRGFVATSGRLYSIAPADDAYQKVGRDSESLVRQIDREFDSPLDRPLFRCDSESVERSGLAVPLVSQVGSKLVARAAATSIPYVATLAVDTDWELYQILGSTSAVTTFVGDLVAAAASIYYRDIRTSLQLTRLDVYSSSSDPWSATDTLAALYEVGAHWYPAQNGVARSSVVFLSGKTSSGMQGGIAWRPGLCELEYGYAVCGAINGQFSTSNPNLYWDLLCFSHELGHNFNSPHTHCYTPQIDQCCTCGAEQCPGLGCPGPVPSGGGTIMSYCHCVSPGLSNIVLYLGSPGQASERVTDVMRAHVESRATSYPSCIPELLQLSVNRNGTGSGTVTSNPAGISCGTTCSALFAKDSSVTLTPTPAGGSAFAGWSGACSGSGSCQVTMNSAKSVTAWFSNLAACVMTVTDQLFTASQLYESCYSIVAGPNVSTTTAAGHLTLRAANQVILRNGFSIGTGARLTVALDPTLAGT